MARVRWSADVPTGDSGDLLKAALARRVNTPPQDSKITPQTFTILYRDGLRASVVHLDAQTRDFLFAGRIAGRSETFATCFYIELYVHDHWGFMVRNFEDLMLTHRNPTPDRAHPPGKWYYAGWVGITPLGWPIDRHSRTQYLLLCSALTTAILPLVIDAQQYTILDIQKVPLTGDPGQALVRIDVPPQPREISCDVLIAGAGMGGIGAALSVTARKHSVCLTEETDWVGGQTTAGGVPALDENRFIEFSGGTRSYMEFRQRVRDWYRENRKLTPQAALWENLNPGSCYVSPLCFEPSVGVAVLSKMLKGRGCSCFYARRFLRLTGRARPSNWRWHGSSTRAGHPLQVPFCIGRDGNG